MCRHIDADTDEPFQLKLLMQTRIPGSSLQLTTSLLGHTRYRECVNLSENNEQKIYLRSQRANKREISIPKSVP